MVNRLARAIIADDPQRRQEAGKKVHWWNGWLWTEYIIRRERRRLNRRAR